MEDPYSPFFWLQFLRTIIVKVQKYLIVHCLTWSLFLWASLEVTLLCVVFCMIKVVVIHINIRVSYPYILQESCQIAVHGTMFFLFVCVVFFPASR